jgi:hypothetical protein
VEANSNEINLLIKAYNGMVDELEKCHQISERELARNGETSGARNQSAYANALNGTKFSAKI